MRDGGLRDVTISERRAPDDFSLAYSDPLARGIGDVQDTRGLCRRDKPWAFRDDVVDAPVNFSRGWLNRMEMRGCDDHEVAAFVNGDV